MAGAMPGDRMTVGYYCDSRLHCRGTFFFFLGIYILGLERVWLWIIIMIVMDELNERHTSTDSLQPSMTVDTLDVNRRFWARK